jgi:hypothetical protein
MPLRAGAACRDVGPESHPRLLDETERAMDWTPDQDRQLRELYAKRVSLSFIASWMRWPPSAIRVRMIELGLVKPRSSAATTIADAAKAKSAVAKAPGALRAVATLRDSLDEEEEMKTTPGCPRGHLFSEKKITELYRAAGSDYR